jgi:hypothetical protein
LFIWKADGTWSYKKNEENEKFRAVVPLADGSFAKIKHLRVNEPTKTLRSMMCPSSCNKGAIKYMQTKGTEWKDMVAAGKLSQQNVWLMMDKQFWP